MSKDMLGSIVRALVRLPENHHGLVLDVVNKLSAKDDKAIHARVARALRQEEIKSQPVLIRPNVVGGTYPAWFESLVMPELDDTGPYAYYANQIERYSHFRKRDAEITTGHYIFDAMQRNRCLGRSLGMADAQAIALLGEAFLRKWCGICELYFWRSVSRDASGNLFVPYIQCDDVAAGDSPKWRSLNDAFGDHTCSASFTPIK